MGIDVIRALDESHHVNDPHAWGDVPAVQYGATFDETDIAAGQGRDLASDGWEASGFSILTGSGAGLLDSGAKGTTGGINFNTNGDYLISPFIFGDYTHGRIAEHFLGYYPTKIVMEVLARFAAGNDEEETGFGFVQDGTDANALVKADLMAFITIDSTDFSLESSADAAAGATKDTNQHLFKIVGTFGSTWEWFIDDVSQGTLAIVASQMPMAWAAGTKASGGANDPVISWVCINYE